MESRGELLGVSVAVVSAAVDFLPAGVVIARGSVVGSRSIGTGFRSDAMFCGERKEVTASAYTLVDSFWALADETPQTGAGEPGMVSSQISMERDSLLLLLDCCLSVVVAPGAVMVVGEVIGDSERGAFLLSTRP